MALFQVAGFVVALGLGLALWQATKRAGRPGAKWADTAVAWYLAFATVWVLVAAVKGVR